MVKWLRIRVDKHNATVSTLDILCLRHSFFQHRNIPLYLLSNRSRGGRIGRAKERRPHSGCEIQRADRAYLCIVTRDGEHQPVPRSSGARTVRNPSPKTEVSTSCSIKLPSFIHETVLFSTKAINPRMVFVTCLHLWSLGSI